MAVDAIEPAFSRINPTERNTEMNPSPFAAGDSVISGTTLPSDLVERMLPLVMQVDPDGGIKSFLQPGDAHHKPTPSEAWLARLLTIFNNGMHTDENLRELDGPDYGVTDTPLVYRAQPRADRAMRVDELVRYLFDKLDHFAPDGCYFGSHGDGSDYGFWPLPDGVEDEGFVQVDLGPSKKNNLRTYVLRVTSNSQLIDTVEELCRFVSNSFISAEPVEPRPASRVEGMLHSGTPLESEWVAFQAAAETWIKHSGYSFDDSMDYLRACLTADDVV